jgi:hypothetical protein
LGLVVGLIFDYFLIASGSGFLKKLKNERNTSSFSFPENFQGIVISVLGFQKKIQRTGGSHEESVKSLWFWICSLTHSLIFW